MIPDGWVHYHLGWGDLLLAAQVGVHRQVCGLALGRQHTYGARDDGDQWRRHIQGACGELVVARLLGVEWTGARATCQSGGTDVGGLEVRTLTDHAWDLIVRAKDPDDALVVLVTGEAPVFRVQGFTQAGWARRTYRPQVLASGRPGVTLVPQADLWPMRSMGLVLAAVA